MTHYWVILTLMNDFDLERFTVSLPPQERLQGLVNRLMRQFRCGAVALLKLNGGSLRAVAAEGLSQDAMGRRFELAHHPRLATIASSTRAVRFDPDSPLPDPYDGLLAGHEGESLAVHDCMGISLYVEHDLWGLLTLDALRKGSLDERAESQLQAIKAYAEASIRLAELEQERLSYRLSAPLLQGSADVRTRDEIIGQSPAIQTVLQELDIVAGSDLPVLLRGETGVGKELFARRLHRLSKRSEAPLVQVNCAALPESLAESELFGHIKGAFSGATTDRAGRLDAADNGTVFLDEVGELPVTVQAKLLRTLQNGEIQRLGADHPRKINVRVIAATNRELQERVRQGHFRADLYHRLSVYPLLIPPLRERGNDILQLAGCFLEINRARLGIRSLRLDSQAEQALLAYAWPGNVRELEHAISRAALKAVNTQPGNNQIVTINAAWLGLDTATMTVSVADDDKTGTSGPPATHLSLKQQVALTQRDAIQQALSDCDGNWSAAARSLQVNSSNLHKLARRLGLKS